MTSGQAQLDADVAALNQQVAQIATSASAIVNTLFPQLQQEITALQASGVDISGLDKVVTSLGQAVTGLQGGVGQLGTLVPAVTGS